MIGRTGWQRTNETIRHGPKTAGFRNRMKIGEISQMRQLAEGEAAFR